MKSIKKLLIVFLQRFAIVIVLIFFFSLLFQFFESPHPANEYKNEEEKVEDRKKIISRSWKNLSKKYNLNVSLSEYMFLMQDLEELSSEVKNARLQKTPWSFMKCLYLTFTIVTTIGKKRLLSAFLTTWPSLNFFAIKDFREWSFQWLFARIKFRHRHGFWLL